MKIKMLKQVTIKRKIWLHGHNKTTRPKYNDNLHDSCLLDCKGYMCCLGQWCEQAGVSREMLRAVSSPGSLPMNIPLLTINNTLNRDSELATKMMAINDSCKRSTKDQEKELTKLAKTKGVKLVFVD